MRAIEVTIGSKLHVSETAIKKIRKDLLMEFEVMPPAIHVKNKETGTNDMTYTIAMDGFGSVTYEESEWDVWNEVDEESEERILFHISRFLRKWFMNAPKVSVEKDMVKIPLVIEYGEELVDTIESERFQEKLKETTDAEVVFWESDFVRKDEFVFYVYGKDYYTSRPLDRLDADLDDYIIEEVAKPIIEENERLFESQR